MDETLRELVSRYSDGDLDDAESIRLEERAQTDPELAAEIDATRQLGEAVAALAGRMEPPVALDKVMEPLCQGAPVPAQRIRPVYRWLGVAAAVVLGVTVTIEMARRNPTPILSRPTPQRDQPVEEREGIFELAPLPTAKPEDNRPLGAVDHLLEEEPSQPIAPEPAPLEVIGPLNTDGSSMDAVEPLSSAESRMVPEFDGLESKLMDSRTAPTKKETLPQTETSEEATSPAPSTHYQWRADGNRESAAGMSDTGKANQRKIAGRRQNVPVSVALRIDGIEVWTGSSSSCSAGTWRLGIEVRGSIVVAMQLRIGAIADEIPDGCTPDELIGSVLENVRDGVHLAEIMVGEPPP